MRASKIASLLDGFSAGYGLVGQVMKDRELRQVAEAAPEVNQGAQPEPDPKALQANRDLASTDYPEPQRTVDASGGVRAPSTYSLLGQTQDQPFTPEQTSKARQLAQAGVLDKFGDTEGAGRIRDRLQRADLTDLQMSGEKQRQGREATTFDWAKKDRDQQEAWTNERQRLMENSAFGQKQAAYSKAMDEYQSAKADYDKKVAAGDNTAVQPSMPAKPAVLPWEFLRDHAKLLANDLKYGKADTNALMQAQRMQDQMEQEGMNRGLRALQDGASIAQVVALFNKSGQMQIDPASVIDRGFVKRPDGMQTRQIEIKNPDGSTTPIDSMAGLQAFKEAGDFTHNFFQQRQLANSDKQVAIAGGHLALAAQHNKREQEAFDTAEPVRQAQADTASVQSELANLDENSPTYKQDVARLTGKLQALKTGSRGAYGNHDPAVINTARIALEAGSYPDMKTAIQGVIEKPDQQHQKLVEAAMKLNPDMDAAITAADKAMARMGWDRSGGRWSKSGSAGPQGGDAPSPKSIEMLRSNPQTAADFDARYGKGAAAAVLGGGATPSPAVPQVSGARALAQGGIASVAPAAAPAAVAAPTQVTNPLEAKLAQESSEMNRGTRTQFSPEVQSYMQQKRAARDAEEAAARDQLRAQALQRTRSQLGR